MDKLLVASVRGVVCILALAGLSACNSDETNAAAGSVTPPVASRPPHPTFPPFATRPPYPTVPPVAGRPPHPTVPPVNPPAIPPPPVTPVNTAPHIAGNPGTQVVVGQMYSFTPAASDANGDALTFAIASPPSWAAFNAHTGRLWGTPGAGDVGSHEEITISVTDGASTGALPRFAITVVQQGNGSVTLAWQAPTENTDGSPLTDLSGYRIQYGVQSHHYTTTITLRNGGLTRYLIENLVPGVYYFAMTALAASGAESDLSVEATKTI